MLFKPLVPILCRNLGWFEVLPFQPQNETLLASPPHPRLLQVSQNAVQPHFWLWVGLYGTEGWCGWILCVSCPCAVTRWSYPSGLAEGNNDFNSLSFI